MNHCPKLKTIISKREGADILKEEALKEGTFKERYLAGEIPFEEIDRYISRWNNSDDPRTLAQYLGLNAEEEDVWIDESDDALQDMLDGQKG